MLLGVWQKAQIRLKRLPPQLPTPVLQCRWSRYQSPGSKKSSSQLYHLGNPAPRSCSLLPHPSELIHWSSSVFLSASHTPSQQSCCWKRDLEKDALKCHTPRQKSLDPVSVAAAPHSAGEEENRSESAVIPSSCSVPSVCLVSSIPGHCLMGISAAGAVSALQGRQAGIGEVASRCREGHFCKLLAEDLWNSCWL